MDRISDKTLKKNKIQSLQESISRIESDITLYKSQGNKRALDASIKVLKCLESKVKQEKTKN